MKPITDRLHVVTASLDIERAADCLQSWQDRATFAWRLHVIKGQMGVVPAFAEGVRIALQEGAEVIACLHDDLLIEDDAWDAEVLSHFDLKPMMGLCGFGGGKGLADADIYQKPYSPHQLARQDFCSNLREAEQHGRRVTRPVRVACLDGFSQIGRRAFWCGRMAGGTEHPTVPIHQNILQVMTDWGIVHHAYDSALGAWARRLRWEVWMLPIACHHFGGRTAVGDPRYEEWARTIVPNGDRDFWELAHREVWERFRDVLPIRTGGG